MKKLICTLLLSLLVISCGDEYPTVNERIEGNELKILLADNKTWYDSVYTNTISFEKCIGCCDKDLIWNDISNTIKFYAYYGHRCELGLDQVRNSAELKIGCTVHELLIDMTESKFCKKE